MAEEVHRAHASPRSGTAHNSVVGCAVGDLLSGGLAPGYDGQSPIQTPSVSWKVSQGHSKSSSTMAWFVMHCPILMECPSVAGVSFVQRLKEANWLHDYLYNVQKTLMNVQGYESFDASFQFQMCLQEVNIKIYHWPKMKG